MDNNSITLVEFFHKVIIATENAETSKNSISSLENRLDSYHKNMTDCINNLESKLNLQNEDIKTVKNILGFLNNREKEYLDMVNIIKSKVNNLEQKFDKAIDVEKELNAKNIELNNSFKLLEEKRNEAAILNGRFSDLQKRLDSAEKALENTKSECDEMGKKSKKKIELLQSTIEELNDKNNNLINNINILQMNIQKWDNCVSVYRYLLEQLNKCVSMKGFYDEIGLKDGDDTEKVLKLIIAIGKEKKFSRDLYNFMKNIKREHPEKLNEDEKNVYDAVNQCYKMACNINFDVFVLPGKKSVLEDSSSQVEFDGREMEDLADPKNKSLKYANEIYIPAIISLDNEQLESRCIVKAGNM